MNELIALTLEALLRSALEAHALQAKIDAEGRTELSADEEKALRDATDVAARVARAKADQL